MKKAKKKNAMDTSTAVLGERNATKRDTMDAAIVVGGNTEKRPRRDALEITLATDLEVVEEHAQWWNPELRPQVESHPSSVMEGVDGAASA